MPPLTDSVFKIKQRDTAPSIIEELHNADGTLLQLGGSTIVFHLSNVNGQVIVNAAAGYLGDGSSGKAQYDWQTGDTAVAGDFIREWEVHLPTGKIITIPDGQPGYPVLISPQIA